MDNDNGETLPGLAIDFDRLNVDKMTRMRRRSSTDSGGNEDDAEPFLGETAKKRIECAPLYGVTESHQYEMHESEVWWHHQLQRWRT